MTSFQGLKGLFGSKKSNSHNNRHIAEIGTPTNVVHDIHVGKNAHGELEGNYFYINCEGLMTDTIHANQP